MVSDFLKSYKAQHPSDSNIDIINLCWHFFDKSLNSYGIYNAHFYK